MKQLAARILTSLLTIVLCSAGSAYAQNPSVIKVNIPFGFSLGDKTFQPGEYSLVQPLQHFLVLRNARGQAIASTFTNGLELSAAPVVSTLKFRSVGGQYVLTEVWQQDRSDADQLRYPGTKRQNYVATHRSAEAYRTAEGSQP